MRTSGGDPRGRRDVIVDAALASFAANGWAGASIADIRARSGASVGSIYHHFGDKNGLLGRVYLAVLARYQEDYLAGLSRATSAQAAVRFTVRHYLGWVEANPDAAAFLIGMRRVPEVMAADRAIRETTRRFLSAADSVFAAFAGRGALRSHAPEIRAALLVAPAAALAESWIAGGRRGRLAIWERPLADAAWRALAPGRARRTK